MSRKQRFNIIVVSRGKTFSKESCCVHWLTLGAIPGCVVIGHRKAACCQQTINCLPCGFSLPVRLFWCENLISDKTFDEPETARAVAYLGGIGIWPFPLDPK